MAHIGVERLGAGDREKDRAEQHEAASGRLHQDGRAVERVERQQDFRPADDPPNPEYSQHRKPDQHDRAE